MAEMTPVQSSNLAAVGYDAASQELTIEFQNGQTYIYDGVDEATYRALMSAPSLGSFFYRNIRGLPYRQG
jgi:hypothetical protein